MQLSVCRRFAGLAAQGKSPTEELLADWGTTNCTVGELVDILNHNKLLAAVTLLLPGMILIKQLWLFAVTPCCLMVRTCQFCKNKTQIFLI